MLTIEDFIDENGNYPNMIECPECGSVEISEKYENNKKIYFCQCCFCEFDEKYNIIEYLDDEDMDDI